LTSQVSSNNLILTLEKEQNW